jgi:uncharacterized membrane protein
MLIAAVDRASPRLNILIKAILCGLIITLVELTFGLIFNVLLGLNVWNYSGEALNLFGQICLPFTLIWGVLVVIAVRCVQPWTVRVLASVPPALTYGVLLAVIADAFFSALVLRRTGDVDMMSLPKLLRALQAE